MFGVVWEGVSEEEIWSLFDGDSSEGVEPALVSFLKLFGEGLISPECSVCHLAYDTKW